MNHFETPSVEWVLNELHVIEQCQSRIEGDQNTSAVALRRAIEIINELRTEISDRIEGQNFRLEKITNQRAALQRISELMENAIEVGDGCFELDGESYAEIRRQTAGGMK